MAVWVHIFQREPCFVLFCFFLEIAFLLFFFFFYCISMLEKKWHITGIQIQMDISTNILQNNIKVKSTTVYVSRNGILLRALN